MYPKNVVESAVRASLDAHRQEMPGADPVCWCPLCTADMQALALSSLPPRYVTRLGTVAVDGVRAAGVREEVARAVRHVANHPKHPEGTASGAAVNVALVNYPFELGFSMVEERLRLHPGACECWECRCDAVAFALNRFPPQYGVAVEGRSTLPDSEMQQMTDEMATFLDLGVRITTALPRHDGDR